MTREIKEKLTTAKSHLLKAVYALNRACKIDKITRVLRSEIWKVRLASLGEESVLYPSVDIHAPNPVRIGAKYTIAEFVHIWGGGNITIGNGVIIASHAVITSQTHDKNAASYRNTIVRSPIVVSDNVWIRAGATILPGIVLGKGCIIGSGVVVTHNVAPGSIVADVPAKPITQQLT